MMKELENLEQDLISSTKDKKQEDSTKIKSIFESSNCRKIIQILRFTIKHHIPIQKAISYPIYLKPHQTPLSKQFFKYVKLGELKKVGEMASVERMQIFQLDYVGKTPCHWAVLRNDLVMTSFFLSLHADFEKRDLNGRTPLSYAIIQDNFEMVKVSNSHIFMVTY